MYISQNHINDSYLVGSDTLTSAILSQFYAEINALSFKDKAVSDKLLVLLYAVNSIDPLKGDNGNYITRDQMLALLTTITKRYNAELNFSKPVVNRHQCNTDVTASTGRVHAVEQYGDFSFTTSGYLESFQFIQNIGKDKDFSASNELSQLNSAANISAMSLIPIYDLISSLTSNELEAQVKKLIGNVTGVTMYYLVPDAGETSELTIPTLIGKSIKLILRGGVGVPEIITGDGAVPTGGIIKFTPATGKINSAEDNKFFPLETLTIQYV